MADVGEIKAKLTLESDKFKKGMNDARNEMDKTGKSALATRKSIDTIQKAAIGMGTAVAATLAASVTVAANFEQQMKNVEAVSGATGAEMQQLTELAKDMGQQTAFSASEAAMGIEELIKAGLTVEQVIGGGLQGALDLAIAGNLQLAQAAEIASTALNAFRDDNLSVVDAANILAGAANASATNVSEMQYGLAQVSAVAAGVGLSFQDTSVALAAFAQNGLKGSDAGTSLKTMLQNLQPTTKEQIALFKQLGLMAADGQNAFYDLNGEIRGMDEIAGVLQDALKDMTSQQRAFALETIFGSDAVRAGNILYKEGAEGLNAMWDAMSKVTAADVATTKMETLRGAFTELTSTLETLGINLSEDLLGPLAQLVRMSTGVLRSLDDMDMANIKAALGFAGTAAAVALVGTSLVKLGGALKTLTLAMGPGGWLIASLSVIGGMFAATAIAQNELNEVTLENADAMTEQRDELSKNIAEFDRLQQKSTLTNDELARFVDINSEISKTTDPTAIAKLREEQEKLTESSGLSNEEMQRLIDLNGEILEVVPESNTTLSEQGNVLLNNTDAAKKYNEEQLELIRLELETQKAKAESNMKQLLLDEKNLISEIKTLKEETNGLDVVEFEQRGKIGDLEAALAKAKSEGHDSEAKQLTLSLAIENKKLQEIKDQRAEQSELVLEKSKELDKIQEQIGKLDEVKRKMIDLELQQVDINAKKGEEIQTIDNTLRKLESQKKLLELTVPVNQRNTGEYAESVGHIEDQISELNEVRSRIMSIIDQAGDMNYELSKSIRKDVIIRQVGGESLKRMPGLDYHTGGIVGKRQMPMLHTGGLASQFTNTPNHNEVDVRLLRDEMVLTEAQQANLMRMIDAGLSSGSNGAGSKDDSDIVNILREIERGLAKGLSATVVMNTREVAREVSPHIKEINESDTRNKLRARGL